MQHSAIDWLGTCPIRRFLQAKITPCSSEVMEMLWLAVAMSLDSATFHPWRRGFTWIYYAQISAGGFHTVLLRSDDSVVACGRNHSGQCAIPVLKPESVFDKDISLGTDLVLQLGVKYVDNNAYTLICKSCV